MATYATYRHVELDRVGLGKRRVLKPPGGGSSISFGEEDEFCDIKPKAAPPQQQQQQEQQQEAPNNGTEDQPAAKAETNGTITPPQTPKDNATATKENNPSAATNGTAVNGTMSNGINGTPSSGSSTPNSSRIDTQSRLFGDEPRHDGGCRRVRDHHRSNIFSGDEGKLNTHKPATPTGSETPEAKTPDQPQPPQPQPQSQQKQRIPPGGFSTKLW